MDKTFSFLLDFIIIFTVVYLLYVLFFNKKRRNYKTLKKNDEVKLFIDRYNLDMKKIEYKKVLQVVTIINTFILSFTTVLIVRIKGFMISLLIGFVVIMILIYSLYEIAGRYFKKKEEDKNV